MDKYQIASEINLAVSYTNDADVISSAGNKLYSYLADNVDEIIGNQRHAYHIGSAMYFYRNYIVDKEDNIEHKLTTLIAYVNLFESFLFHASVAQTLYRNYERFVQKPNQRKSMAF